MKVKYKARVVIPPTEKTIEIETIFEFEADVFDEEAKEQEHSYTQITEGTDTSEFTALSKEEEEEGDGEAPSGVPAIIGFETSNDNRRRRRGRN